MTDTSAVSPPTRREVGHGQRDDTTNGMTQTRLRSTHMNELSLAVTNGFMLTPPSGVTKVCPRHPTHRAAPPHQTNTKPLEPCPSTRSENTALSLDQPGSRQRRHPPGRRRLRRAPTPGLAARTHLARSHHNHLTAPSSTGMPLGAPSAGSGADVLYCGSVRQPPTNGMPPDSPNRPPEGSHGCAPTARLRSAFASVETEMGLDADRQFGSAARWSAG